ncbi:MAG: B12-binding domain-containing radical SAM protein [Candidatus Aenigmarchaeota archaeon]|nr:B12-binding domain-containing radical SAM protein [Candidatus Aenigmarchaeota archaeon]
MTDSISLVNTNYASNPMNLMGKPRPEGISSPAVRPQLGLASLGAYLGCYMPETKVYLVDAVLENLAPEETAKRALNEAPGAIGVSSTYHNLKEALGVLRSVKKDAPDTITILGGPGARSLFDIAGGKDVEYVNYAVMGDGELDLERILEKASIPKETQFTQDFVSLNILPSAYDLNPETERPYLDMFDVEGYFKANRELGFHGRPSDGKLLTDYTCKGCGWRRCAHCSTETPWRGRSPKRLGRDLQNIKDFYGENCELFIVDDNPTTGPDSWIIETYRTLGESGFPWHTQIRVDEALKKCGGKLPQIMADSGCTSVSIGAESGSQKVLDALKKGITPQQTLDAVKAFGDAGIKTSMFLMYNCPEEDKSDLDRTLEMARKAIETGNIESVLAFEYVPIPGSRAYRQRRPGGNIKQGEKEYFRDKLLEIGRGKAAVIPGTYK